MKVEKEALDKYEELFKEMIDFQDELLSCLIQQSQVFGHSQIYLSKDPTYDVRSYNSMMATKNTILDNYAIIIRHLKEDFLNELK